jgi:hypothetical protein
VSIGAWAGGWAGDTRHIEICWIDHEPAEQGQIVINSAAQCSVLGEQKCFDTGLRPSHSWHLHS